MSKFHQIVKSNKITPENLKYIFINIRLLFLELKLMRNPSYLEKHETLCADVIALIIEYIVTGDKSNQMIFE